MSLKRVNELRARLKKRGITPPRHAKLAELEALDAGKSAGRRTRKKNTKTKRRAARAGQTADEFRWGWHCY
jgi:hypothetical protein